MLRDDTHSIAVSEDLVPSQHPDGFAQPCRPKRV